jgi:hypothetical protein
VSIAGSVEGAFLLASVDVKLKKLHATARREEKIWMIPRTPTGGGYASVLRSIYYSTGLYGTTFT